jgi:ribulose 1,5-bisphosphate carboxylase large subunit-like protein
MSEPAEVKMKIWNVAAKVCDVDAEIKFVQELGGALILDETLTVEGKSIRVALMKWADKYLHLFAHAIYESRLERQLPCGLCHVVIEVSDLALQRRRALEAGAHEVMPPQFIDAGFGTRDVAFLRSPGGILFELIRVHEHRVPELP